MLEAVDGEPHLGSQDESLRVRANALFREAPLATTQSRQVFVINTRYVHLVDQFVPDAVLQSLI